MSEVLSLAMSTVALALSCIAAYKASKAADETGAMIAELNRKFNGGYVRQSEVRPRRRR